MSTPKLLKFYFQNASGSYYYVDADGNVQLTAVKTAIKDSPKDWDKITFKVGRSDRYFGINTSITTPVMFWGDAAKIIRSLYYQGAKINHLAYCKVTIEKRIDDDGANVWGYTRYGNEYEIDFANELTDEAIEVEGDIISVRLIESSVTSRLLANADTDFDIPFDGDAQNVEISGKELQAAYRWLSGGQGAVNINSTLSGTAYVVPMGLIKEETDYFRNIIETQNSGSEVFALTGFPNDTNKILYTDISYTGVPFTLAGEVVFQNTSGVANAQVVVELLRKNMLTNALFGQTLYSSATGLTGTVTLNIGNTGTVNLDSQIYTYFLIIRVGATASGSVSIQVNDIDFKLNVTSVLPATVNTSFKYKDFAAKVVSKASNSEATLAAGFLNFSDTIANLYKYFYNLPSYTNVTCGNALRGLANSVIKTSFDRMFQDMYSRWMVGMDVTGNTVRFEQLPYFFRKNSTITTIQSVSKLRKRTATEWLYNSIKVGYEDQTLDKLNAKFEVNSEQQYSLFLKRITKELNLISDYRADVYGIEYIRGDLTGKDTTDNEGDNDVFLLEVSNTISGGNNTLLRYSNPPDSITGVFSPYTHYNWGFAPDLSIYRHSPYFKSILSSPDDNSNNGDRVSFVSAKKNDSYNRFIQGYVINGGDNIFITSSYQPYQGDRLFSPIIFTFECESSENLLTSILNNPYGVIRFNDNGVEYAGFIIDADITAGSTDAAKFTLLGSPENDYGGNVPSS